jgi:hypothetical protein
VKWQKVLNMDWPLIKNTLQEQWESLGVNVITARIVIPMEQTHLEEFSRFLSSKIKSILAIKPNFTLVQSAVDEICYGKDIIGVIRVQQEIILNLTTELPSSLTGIIGRYIDERHASKPTDFGLSIYKRV